MDKVSARVDIASALLDIACARADIVNAQLDIACAQMDNGSALLDIDSALVDKASAQTGGGCARFSYRSAPSCDSGLLGSNPSGFDGFRG